MVKQALLVTFAATLAAGTLASVGTAGAAPVAGAPGTAARQAQTAQELQTTRAAQAARAARAARAGRLRHVAYHAWGTPRRLRNGHRAGVVVRRSGVQISSPVARTSYRDAQTGARLRYDLARWVSPWVAPGFNLTQAVASWKAQTPKGTFVRVQMRGRTPNGRRSSWDTLGDWASHERRFHRTTFGSQADDVTDVAVDTLRTRGRATLARWQVRVVLFRRAGTSVTPKVRSVGAMVSRLPAGSDAPTTRTTMRTTVDLAVPRHSQMIHRGDYPQYGNGGEAWCSPTSTSMVLGFWNRGPRPGAYSWVKPHRDRVVDYTARSVYDYGYEGAGNWPFNTAYANRWGTRSFVTRLRSLREAERFIRAGIPLVASIRFGPGGLDGAPISSTAGHLLVIRGFRANGRVIVNDPAARNDRSVRKVYRRDQFADAWVGGSGGLVYVIRPEGKALPRRVAEANW